MQAAQSVAVLPKSLAEAGYAEIDTDKVMKEAVPPPIGLLFTQLQPVVSVRLVSTIRVRTRVLSYASKTTGLESLIKGTSALPVPVAHLGQLLLWTDIHTLAHTEPYTVSM